MLYLLKLVNDVRMHTQTYIDLWAINFPGFSSTPGWVQIRQQGGQDCEGEGFPCRQRCPHLCGPGSNLVNLVKPGFLLSAIEIVEFVYQRIPESWDLVKPGETWKGFYLGTNPTVAICSHWETKLGMTVFWWFNSGWLSFVSWCLSGFSQTFEIRICYILLQYVTVKLNVL